MLIHIGNNEMILKNKIIFILNIDTIKNFKSFNFLDKFNLNLDNLKEKNIKTLVLIEDNNNYKLIESKISSESLIRRKLLV